ncbi:lysozyme [Campylobacter sp. CX2-8023-23]|uniref:glycoside hydrolase family protein n=1 Tax=Campylobacter porcelli TaxID=1660073 RepID=UPI002ECAE097|nr:lysozyme [Campylobacter sp. CX2-8023-23]
MSLSKDEFNELVEVLKSEEGFRDKIYQCTAGVDTIGYGFNVKYLSSNEITLNNGVIEPMSKEVAGIILHKKLKKLIKSVDEIFTWVDDLPGVVKIGVYDMVYQLGLKSFGGFTNTIKHLKDGEYEKARQNIMNSRWAKQTPRRAGNMCARLIKASLAVNR